MGEEIQKSIRQPTDKNQNLKIAAFLIFAFCLLICSYLFGQGIVRNADQVLNATYDSTNTAIGVSEKGSWTIQPGNTPNTTAWLVTGTGGTFPVTFPTADPCLSPGIAKSSVAINIAAAATTQLVGFVSGQTIYACNANFTYSVAGSAQFEYGTGTNCGTGTTTLTGAMVTTANEYLPLGWGGTIFKTAASNALCVVTTGTTPSMQGVLTYVQQ